MKDYEKLLSEAYKKVKPVKTSSQRFEIPKVTGRIEGKKTIITNFLQIVSYLRRKPEHLAKFLFKELASSGNIENERLVLNSKIPSSKINNKIQLYAKEYVICKECGKPDTELIKKDRITFLHCLACGAKHSVK